MSKRVVIKVGTKVLTDEHGVLSEVALARIVTQIARLKRDGHEVALVSSGAMGAGKSVLRTTRRLTALSEKQLFAAVGQVRLMSDYSRLFGAQALLCAQVLATKEDFRDRSHFFNMRSCFEALLHDSVVPVVNENDVVALDELTFTDNDELAGLVASMLNADLLLILSSVDGVLNESGQVITEISGNNRDRLGASVTGDKSEAGRGGMITKYEVARRAAKQGIETIIANGTRDGIMVAAVNGEKVGTRFAPGKRLTNAQRRLAHSDALVQGKVFVNECAARSLGGDAAASLLPVGVTKLEGEFNKGDVIEICGPAGGKRLGYGVSRYSASEARPNLGQKNAKPLIHYDYMFIE
jgi:glutamate 5-kinase